MMCQECGKKTATVHFTKIVNGEKSEFHLCETCAREKGEAVYKSTGGFSINSLLGGLLNYDAPSGSTTTQQSTLRCSTCGLTYSQFSQVGRFGCSDCYSAFAQRLDPLLRRIHGSTSHTGKIPKRKGGAIKLRKDLDSLRHQLQQMIQQERFEEAAVLRDKIKEMEQNMQRG